MKKKSMQKKELAFGLAAMTLAANACRVPQVLAEEAPVEGTLVLYGE